MLDINISCDIEGNLLSLKAEGCYNKSVTFKDKIFHLFHPNYVVSIIKIFMDFVNSGKTDCEIKNVLFKFKNEYYRSTLFLKRNYVSNTIDVRVIRASNANEAFKLKLSDLFFITRFKFTLGSGLPFLFAALWSFYKYENISYNLLGLTFLTLILMHLAANTFNDYFDWVSGRDKINKDYVMSNTGGSRSIDLNIISEEWMFKISWLLITCVLLLGTYFVYVRGFIILLLGLVGFCSLYFYSAPPIHLASRYGLGEVMHIFCLGPVITYGTTLMLTGDAGLIDFVIGIPFGILITCCLLVNEYPDSISDDISAKKNLAVLLTVKYIPVAYTLLSLSAILITCYFVLIKALPSSCYMLLCVSYVYYLTIKDIFSLTTNRVSLINACNSSFKLYLYYSLLVSLGLLFAIFIK